VSMPDTTVGLLAMLILLLVLGLVSERRDRG